MVACYLRERRCHHVELLTNASTRSARLGINNAISLLKKEGAAIVGVCFSEDGLRFGIFEVKSGKHQTSRRCETRALVAGAVREAYTRVYEAGLEVADLREFA